MSSRTRVEVPLPFHAYNLNPLPSRIRAVFIYETYSHAFSQEERPCEVYYPSCQLPSGGAFCRPPCRLLRSNRATTQCERLNGIFEVRYSLESVSRIQHSWYPIFPGTVGQIPLHIGSKPEDPSGRRYTILL